MMYDHLPHAGLRRADLDRYRADLARHQQLLDAGDNRATSDTLYAPRKNHIFWLKAQIRRHEAVFEREHDCS
jgi:hypothetical protein